MTGLSVWWATPARAQSHFTAGELARSERFHGRLRRAGLIAGVAKPMLLVLATLILARVVGPPEGRGPGSPIDGVGWWTIVTSGRLALAATATVLALRLPAIAADAWFEYRFDGAGEPRRPVPARSFGVTVTVLALGSWLVTIVVAGVGYRLTRTTSSWPPVATGLAVVGVVVMAMTLAALLERPVRSRWTGREQPLDAGSPAAAEFEELTARFSAGTLGDVDVLTRDPGRASGAVPDGSVPSACALGIGARRRVVVSEALLRADRRTRDFVIAHELTHIARHHVAARGAVAGASLLLAVAAVAVLASTDRPWSWFGLAPTDPIGLPLVVLVLLVAGVVIGIPASWVSRLQERSADSGAMAVVGPLPARSAKGLFLDGGVDLDPPRWTWFHRQHPTPAERLEFLSRGRRAATPVGHPTEPPPSDRVVWN